MVGGEEEEEEDGRKARAWTGGFLLSVLPSRFLEFLMLGGAIIDKAAKIEAGASSHYHHHLKWNRLDLVQRVYWRKS